MSSMLIAVSDIRENKVALRCVDRQSKAYSRLVVSMRRRGMSNPLTVRKVIDFEGEEYYEHVDGLHRLAALKEIGWKQAKCIVVKLNDEDCLLAQIHLQKNDKWIPTTDEDYSRQLRRILSINHLMTLREMATRCNRSSQWVNRVLLGKRLTDHIYSVVYTAQISLMNAYALSKLPKGEQRNWVDRAKTLRPQDFVPMSNDRVAQIAEAERKYGPRETWVNRIGFRTGGVVTRYVDKDLGIPVDVQNPCGEITLTTPKNVVSRLEASEVKEDIAAMKKLFDKALGRSMDAYEMLHGRKRRSIAYETIRPAGQRIGRMSGKGIITGPELQVRKGWDNIRSHGRPGYCRGDVAIRWTGNCWTIDHPVFKTLANESYSDLNEVMDIVEKHFD